MYVGQNCFGTWTDERPCWKHDKVLDPILESFQGNIQDE